MASVRVKLKTDKKLNDDTHPIIIQVIHNRKRKVFYLGYSATKNQWDDKKQIKSNHPEHKIIKSRIKNDVLFIKNIIADLENKHKPFRLEDIEKKYRNRATSDTLEDYTKGIIEKLEKQGKTGNAKVYQTCLDSVKSFVNNKKVKFHEIDYQFVKSYQDYLHQKEVILYKDTDKKTTKKLTVNTISVYLRTLRAIVNKAIKDGLMDETAYPFKNISIKSQKTRKRAVNKDIIKMVEELDVPENLQLWKDLFMFSFYNRGMNMVDMAYLKVKNIEAGRLNYTRKKTGQQFSIKVTDKSKAIISRYNDLKDPESYIFPIIYRKGKEYLDYRNAMRLMNKKLKKISELLNLDVALTTYVSRHSWATIAKRSGIATAVISEGLGHESEETTQVYLDSFENDVLDDANDQIIN
ncbi:MAG: phage integrase SAM-like domain-containing protein [Bacteroidota bacterium]